ncbi:hypothetical protein [Streptomyces sp. YPW6]
MNDTYAFIEAEKTTHGVAFLCCLVIETFYDRRRLRRHKVFGYLIPAETR